MYPKRWHHCYSTARVHDVRDEVSYLLTVEPIFLVRQSHEPKERKTVKTMKKKNSLLNKSSTDIVEALFPLILPESERFCDLL